MKKIKIRLILSLVLVMLNEIGVCNKMVSAIEQKDDAIKQEILQNDGDSEKGDFYESYHFREFFKRQVEKNKVAKEKLDASMFNGVETEALNVHGLNDDFNIEADADVMFEKVSEFLGNSEHVDVKDFEDCVLAYMHNDWNNKAVKTVTSSEFDGLPKDDYIVLYRGIDEKPSAEKLRSGEVVFTGTVSSTHGSNEGLGIYTTSNFQVANFWAQVPIDRNTGETISGRGEVVRFAIQKDAKIVDADYLRKVFDLMLKRYANYFKDYLELEKIFGDRSPEFWLSGFRLRAKFVKEKTGFDFFADVDKKDANQRCNEHLEKEHEILEKIKSSSGDPHKSFEEEVDRFMKENSDLNSPKKHYIDKVYFMRLNAGLLAKIMGYDGVYAIAPDDGLESVDFDGGDGKKKKVIEDTFNVVNCGKLLVCGDCFKEVNLARTKEVII